MQIKLASHDAPTGKEWMAGKTALIPKPRNTFETKSIQYNQKALKHQNGCTIVGSLTALSALTGYEFKITEINNILDDALSLGFNPKWGWWTNKAVDLVRDTWNKANPDNKVISLRESAYTPAWHELINKGYQQIISAQLSSLYWKDVFSDGDLDLIPDENGFYGHVFSGYRESPEMFINVENYYRVQRHNTYEVTEQQFRTLLANLGTDKVKYLPANYFFVSRSDFEALNNGELKVSSWAEESWKKYSKYFDNPNPQELVDASQIEWFFHKIGDLKEVSGLNQERLCVLRHKFDK